MDPVLLILACAVAGLGYWWYLRRQPKPVEDEWVLPPESEAPAPHLMERASETSTATDAASGAGFILDREFLLNRDRTFDPLAWDNTPDAPGRPTDDPSPEDEVEGELPTYLDREYLEKRARERGKGDPA